MKTPAVHKIDPISHFAVCGRYIRYTHLKSILISEVTCKICLAGGMSKFRLKKQKKSSYTLKEENERLKLELDSQKFVQKSISGVVANLRQQNAELLEALKNLKSRIDHAKSEYNAAYVIETEDYKMIESLINKYTQS